MAPRGGVAAVEETLGGLTFNQPISWRAGKPIQTSELLKRLATLSDELQEMDQEETDKDSLTGVAKELAAQNLLSHKDKGVRAFTAQCLVDVLKLCAPDAPFTASQLKDIFELIITSIFPALSDPSNAYNPQHKYVLVSLVEAKSIVLVNDLPNADTLLVHLFNSFFDIISGSSKTSTGEAIAKDVEYQMTSLLVTLVDEAVSLPSMAVDIIVAQFLRASVPGGWKKNSEAQSDDKQSTLLPKELPVAYNMAKTICNANPEKMGRYISQYFNEVILDSSGSSKANGHHKDDDDEESDEEGGVQGPSDQDMKELDKAHNLLRELWRASPLVLQNVIPQLDAELSAESVQLRLLATETLGDIISGIGAAGPPPAPVMDPAAYPSLPLEEYPPAHTSDSLLTTPISPQSFAQTHSEVYKNFIKRGKDRSQIIRSAWATAIGRILVTSGGGIGLSREEETVLVKALGEKLSDSDEKVRLSAVKAISTFSLRDVMSKLAPHGDVLTADSVLSTVADRVKDRKHAVRVEAMTTLGKLWGVAVGEISAGNDSVIAALGGIPSRIFDAYYANDIELNVLLDHVLFEQLLPLGYPPKKPKSNKTTNGNSQTQGAFDANFDPDNIRTKRILLLVQSLNPKSKKAFFAILGRQATYTSVLQAFLTRCEEYNGGVMEENPKETKSKLDAIIKWFTNVLPDSLRVSSDLQRYAKLHDRRSYQLLRFAMDPEKDFKTVHNSIKEFLKRINEAPTAPAGILETLLPIIYRSSSLIYNKSHLPTILQLATSSESELQTAASELNQEISQRMPDIFKNNIAELCTILSNDVPSATKPNEPSTVQTLRALAQFAKGRKQDLPKDRKFAQTLLHYALYGTPAKAAKYAVNILMIATDRKEMYIKDLLEKTTVTWTYGKEFSLTKLATISQLALLDPDETESANDDILDITTRQILLEVRTPSVSGGASWQTDAEVDEECEAKCWALLILVNRVRTMKDDKKAREIAAPVFKLLNALVANDGEMSRDQDTPTPHKLRLKLRAAQLLLKLCKIKLFDAMLTPTAFNRLAITLQDPNIHVRRGYMQKLQKYLVKNLLPHRFYSSIFLTVFEPDLEFKNSTTTWIKSQSSFLERRAKKHVMEASFAQLLSLLAHHPDYPVTEDDDAALLEEFKDHGRYILYYLTTVATEENLGLIYKYAERVKQTRDAIDPSLSERLYVMSDLAQAIITKWETKKGWRIQVWPSKVGLPVQLFAALPTHEVAQEIAEKDYLPDGLSEVLDSLLRAPTKKPKQKRKNDDQDEEGQPSAKKQKSSSKSKVRTAAAKPAKEKKTPKPKKQKDVGEEISTADRRKSGRSASAKKVYRDRDDSEDEEEMLDGVAAWEYDDGVIETTKEAKMDVDSDDDGASLSEVQSSDEELVAPSTSKLNGNAKSSKRASGRKAAVSEDVEMEDTPAPTPSVKKANARSSARKPKEAPLVEDEVEEEPADIEMEDSPPPSKSTVTKAKGRTPAKKAVATNGSTPKVGSSRRGNTKVPAKSPTPAEDDEDKVSEASAEPEPKPVASKKTKGKAKAKSPTPVVEEQDEDELSEAHPSPKPAPRKGRGRAKAAVEEEEPAPPSKKDKAKSRAKSPTPVVAETREPAPKRGKAKRAPPAKEEELAIPTRSKRGAKADPQLEPEPDAEEVEVETKVKRAPSTRSTRAKK